MRPNLFIIGAAKCGTTSLHHALSAHPDIFMSNPKEPGYFVPEFSYLPKSEEWYSSLFSGADGCRYAGESSTHYAKKPYYEGVPGRLHAFNPSARILYLMRDPVERAISHYRHNTRSARPEFHEPRPMMQALEADPNYRNFGDYPMQLAPWLDRFGEQVLMLVYEEMIDSPERTFEAVLRWLEVPPAELSLERRNTRAGQMRARTGIIERFRHSRLWEHIAPLVPKRLRERARDAATVPQEPAHPDESEAARGLLRPWAEQVRDETEELLGRELPWCRADEAVR